MKYFTTLILLSLFSIDVVSLYTHKIFNAVRLKKQHDYKMVMDDFILQKLDSITRTFQALTERLADPDVTSDRKQMLDISKERASIERTVDAFNEWKQRELERVDLVEMENDLKQADVELREMVKVEMKELLENQKALEEEITLLLLPKDLNDDRNVMLEVRAGTGGDEASIFAGDLVNIYRKYCENQGWKVVPISETEGDMGGYKTCVLQVTGDYVYSKLKYEVSKCYHTHHYQLLVNIIFIYLCII